MTTNPQRTLQDKWAEQIPQFVELSESEKLRVREMRAQHAATQPQAGRATLHAEDNPEPGGGP